MEKLQVDQLTVITVPPATKLAPVDGRQYTIESRVSGKHVLSIGVSTKSYSENNEESFILEWKPRLGEYILIGNFHFTAETIEEQNRSNYLQWKRNINSLLTLIINADRELFQHVPWLIDAPILIDSYNHRTQKIKTENFGTPRKYLLKEKAKQDLN